MAEETSIVVLTDEELYKRAEALVPVLADRAGEAEKLRRVPDETIADLKEAGLLGLATPKVFGGRGAEFSTVFEVGRRLAHGCGSTSWVYMVSSIHNYQLALASAEAQEEFFSDPAVLSASAVAPMGTATEADGGWTLQGSWGFSSGCDHAVWLLLGAIVPGRGHSLLMVPRDQVEIVDDWYVSGLRATGSKTIRIADPIFVPEHRCVPLNGLGDPELRDRDGRSSYGAPITSILPYTLCAPLIGMAQAAVDLFVEQSLRRRIYGRPVHEMAATQLRVAESAAEVDAAITVSRDRIAEHERRGRPGEQPFDQADRLRFRLSQVYATRLCVSAVNRVFDAAGGSALYDANPMQRFHRDIHAGSHQVGLSWDENAVLYGRDRFDLEIPAGMW